MKATFCDYEDGYNIMNGRSLNASEVLALLRALQAREPFISALDAEGGTLLVGIGREQGFVQFSPAEGGPPYQISKSDTDQRTDSYLDLLCGSTPTPIPTRNCLPWPVVEAIVTHFIENGGSIPGFVEWEEVGPT